MTGEETRDLVAIIAATWTRPPVTEPTVYAYAYALADLELGAAKAAVLELMQTSRFLPTIAEIRERAIRSRVALPTAEEGWGIVHRAIGRHGSYRVPVFDCEEIQLAVDVIGWKEICLGENTVANRARWIDAFKGFAARRLETEATGRYRAPDRLLPAAGEPPLGEVCVLVETGYATPRASRPALRAVNRSDEIAEFGKTLVGGLADCLTRSESP